MKIQAYAALGPKEPLTPFTYEEPDLESHEILVQITHCGVCHTDLHMIDNALERSTYPLVPGHEVVGQVVKKGEESSLEIGQRVGVGWNRSSCLKCYLCLEGNTNLCQKKQTIYSQGKFGGFADYIVADSRFCFSIPEELESSYAAPLLCAGATVFAPIVNFNLSSKHTVGVIGIGGLGHLALQYYSALGCDLAAISSRAGKEKEAISFGSKKFYTFDHPPPALTFDFLLCTSDAPLLWNQILSYLKPNGILCMVSRPPKGMMIDPKCFVSTQRKICGSSTANRKVTRQMLEFSARHNIKPMIELMPMEKVNDAIERLRKGKVRYRIVLEMD